MELVLPLKDLKLKALSDLEVGDFFLHEDVTCVRVGGTDEEIRLAFLRFDTLQLHYGFANSLVLPLASSELRLRFDTQPERQNKYTPGALHFIQDDAVLTVGFRGLDGFSDQTYVSVVTWNVHREHPPGEVVHSKWAIIRGSGAFEERVAGTL